MRSGEANAAASTVRRAFLGRQDGIFAVLSCSNTDVAVAIRPSPRTSLKTDSS